ncbi:MAG: acyl-CoA dehydrogenase family protein [Porphyrobacter sp.]|nr:acyl-CoA dehydrogenase family protein [Porphyrobacter sp.]
MDAIRFANPPRHEAAERLRGEVRAFLDEQLKDRSPLARSESWNGFSREFSRAMGRKGWLGMTWPKRYGGHERSAFERYVVVEETLAAGAPVAAHWFADRQSGPSLLRYGTEAQKMAILPGIAAGELAFCIGMSEPDSGSDLAATRTRAERTGEGWRITGTKIWTSNAHRCDWMILFCRTSGGVEKRQAGTSQLLVDLRTTPGITIRPIIDLAGQHHFNEVHFEAALVPHDALLGTEGEGWNQVMSELAFERSGPERFLSSIQLIVELIEVVKTRDSDLARAVVGRLTAHLLVLRRLSRGVAAMLETGENPSIHAAIVKDLGAVFEQSVPEIARTLVDAEPGLASSSAYNAVLANIMLNAPSWSLRGGTREILRGIIARGLGLR